MWQNGSNKFILGAPCVPDFKIPQQEEEQHDLDLQGSLYLAKKLLFGKLNKQITTATKTNVSYRKSTPLERLWIYWSNSSLATLKNLQYGPQSQWSLQEYIHIKLLIEG